MVVCLLCAGCASSVPARGDGGEPLFFEIDYAERCEGFPGCVDSDHHFCGNVDGDTCEAGAAPFSGMCSALPIPGGSEVFFEVHEAGTDMSGLQVVTTLSAQCGIKLFEADGGWFGGDCDELPGGEPARCSVTNVRLYDAGGGVAGLEGDFLCRGLPRAPDGTRGISAIGEGMEATPAHFRVVGCSGLSL